MKISVDWLKTSAKKLTEKFLQEEKSNHLKILPEGLEPPTLNINDYSTQNYFYKEKRKIFFAVNSGLCNLQCPYCITDRPNIKSNLNKDDFSFIFNYFGENIYFIFSGLGDFFCGYSVRDQLLMFLLQHDVTIFLDINGVDIKELGDHDLEGKEKIDMIDISYHFGTMKKQKVLHRWVNSVEKIHENKYNYYIKMIPSPLERDLWEEAIRFYEKEVFPITGKKLMLFPDTNTSVDLIRQLDEFERITADHKDAVSILVREGLFKKSNFPSRITPPCPAGSRYFRIFHTGDIVPCEFLSNHFKLGNLKRREVITLREDVFCNYTGMCDCGWTSWPRVRLLDHRNKSSTFQRGIKPRWKIFSDHSSRTFRKVRDSSPQQSCGVFWKVLDKPYPRRIIYEFESKLQTIPFLRETGNITLSIDKLEEEGQIVKNIKIEGWAFINGTGSEESNCYIVLKSDRKSYVFDSYKRRRPDLTAHFKTMNYDDSGFFAFIPKGDLEAGQYKIGIYIKKDNTNAFQYTDKIITIDRYSGISVGK